MLNEDRATIILATAIKAARDLGDVVPVLGDDDGDLKIAISTVVYEIMQTIVSPMLESLPSMKEVIEGRVEKYGRAF